MNHIAKTLLNVMRIEVLLGIGLVAWVFSLEARSAPEPNSGQLWTARSLRRRWIEYSASNAKPPPKYPAAVVS